MATPIISADNHVNFIAISLECGPPSRSSPSRERRLVSYHEPVAFSEVSRVPPPIERKGRKGRKETNANRITSASFSVFLR
jgi:hypothetical protein